MAVAKAKVSKGGTQAKVHAGRYVHDQAYNEEQHDMGPWTETPASTRVSAFRFDYLNRALQVTWRNNKNHGYIYIDMGYEAFRSFARAASKGRNVNSNLNGYEYRLMTPEELSAPTNPNREGAGPRSRARA